MRIEYAKLALDHILEIAEFRFPDDAGRARAWMGEVIDHAAQLETFPRIETFPRMGGRISSGRGPGGEEQDVRRLLFKDVWIVYEVREADPESAEDHPDDHILVLTVRHVREKPDDD
jgi:plasmid stabilization system protein ParE